jgi:hypothetical protein
MRAILPMPDVIQVHRDPIDSPICMLAMMMRIVAMMASEVVSWVLACIERWKGRIVVCASVWDAYCRWDWGLVRSTDTRVSWQ